jgi:GAF domain-containing protein
MEPGNQREAILNEMSSNNRPIVTSTETSNQLLQPHQAFAELSKITFGDMPLGAVLERVAELAKQTIAGADEVSVTLMDNDKARSVAFTGDLAVDLDERQYEKGYGPCLDAAQTGTTISIEDTAHSDTYSDFGKACQRRGVTRTLSLGMPIPQRSVGALNVYGRHGTPFDADTIALGQTFASYAAVALSNAALFNSARELAEQMQQALTSRAVIEQAKGIIMATEKCSPAEAFTRLTKRSQNSNRKLRVIAEEVVATYES